MPPAPVPSLRGRVLAGLAWKAASQLLGQGSQTLVAIILARILVPGDFGLAAMVIVFAAVVPVFSDLALGSALVQRKSLSEADRSTVFWTSLGVGAVFTLLGVAASWPIAGFYGEPEVQPLFAALSLTFVVTALGGTQKALLTREMDFRRLESLTIAGNLAAGAGGVALALGGAGAWAIIGQQIIAAFLTSVLLFTLTPWRPRLSFSLASLRGMAGFSANVFGTRILFYANRNADNLLIGRVLGAPALGAYALAYNLMLAPSARLTWPLTEVLFPAFSRMQDEPARVAAAWIRVNRLVGSITIPAMLGLAVVSPEFVVAVLGDKWSEAIPVIRLLAWVGLLQSLQGMNSAILVARDRTHTLLRFAAVALVASLTAFGVGITWGIVGVAAAYALASTVIDPYFTFLTARALETTAWRFWTSLSGVAQASLGMVAAVLAAREVLLGQGFGAGPTLVTLIAFGIAVYVPLLAWRAPEIVEELRDLLAARRTAPPVGAVAAES